METITAAEYKELNFQIPKRMKYRNVKTVIDEITFDSKKEANYYSKLKLLQKSGEVISFDRQVRYNIVIDGQKICAYVADFVVKWKSGDVKVIDVKGISTPIFKLKAKLMKAVLGIEIFIV